MSYLCCLPQHYQWSHGFSSCLPVFDVFQEPFIVSIGTLSNFLFTPAPASLETPCPSGLALGGPVISHPDYRICVRTALCLQSWRTMAQVYPFIPDSLKILPTTLNWSMLFRKPSSLASLYIIYNHNSNPFKYLLCILTSFTCIIYNLLLLLLLSRFSCVRLCATP